jgi:6-phosphogluconate dehydrogenase (decarboxylating)
MMSLPSRFPTAINSDGASIMDISRNQITVLNRTGEFIWTRLQRGESLEDVIRQLAEQSNTGPDVVARGAQRFLDQLAAEHLLNP